MSLPAPYYDRDGITIYHGDCRDLLPLVVSCSPEIQKHRCLSDVAVITDPVWPNASVPLAGSDDPEALFGRALLAAPWPRDEARGASGLR